MGQQQLLLIMLGVIVVGAAIVVGIQVFQTSSIEHNRDSLLSECMLLASMAQQYYRVPIALGGGNRTFTNWGIPSNLKNSDSGTFTAITTANDVTITAIGNEVLSNGENIKVKLKVLSDDTEILLLK